ncbi:uncharacterized protein LOC106640892 [Copidosoma floridanum]|uniref:uncharacterized protein LOC106640892 n=1 Tax=Copidosoma floridanum TaxID=29053 RepID=UPI0006C95938|nr:uncharacterized protein LOC106640892 [Copidosoma floridanum]
MMRKKYFSSFEEQGFLFYYVDDSIYITKSQSLAMLYLDRIIKGIPEYNCWFNKSKLKINFDSSYVTIEQCLSIDFLGWKIHCDSLEVEPTYEVARYSTTYTRLSYLSLQKKILSMMALKIKKLVLSNEVNSETRVINNIKIIVLQHAKRCFSWFNCIWSDGSEFSIKNLRKSNRQLIRKIERFTDWDKNQRNRYHNQLQYIVWTSFIEVFNKKNSMFLDQIAEFKKLMRYYKKKLNA